MWTLPVLVIEPWCLDAPLECSEGTSPVNAMYAPGRGEAQEVARLGEYRHRGEGVDPAKRPQASHARRERFERGELLDLAVDRAKLGVAHEVGAQQMLEGRLGHRLVEAQGPHPDLEAESSTSRWAPGSACRSARGSFRILCLAILLSVLISSRARTRSRTASSAGVGTRTGDKLAGAMQPGQVPRVDAVGFHAHT